MALRIGPVSIGRTTALVESKSPDVMMREVREEVNQEWGDTVIFMRERLAELELALEDQGWQRVLMDGERELSRGALKRLCALSRLMYLKNPLINRAVTLKAAYVFGQGMNVSSEDDACNEVIQDFMDDYANQAELTTQQNRMLKEVDLGVLGNIFFVLFTAPDKAVKVRTISVEEIDEIICNPEDAKEPWFYRRTWTKRGFDAESGMMQGASAETTYYPCWRYEPDAKPSMINGKPVMWDAPVYHVKVGGMSEMRFGVPETYAAIDWARAYKDFLEDIATQMRALTRFAWSLTTTGGKEGVAAAKTKFATTLGRGNNSGVDANPAPNAGSTFIGAGGNKLDPINTRTSAIDGEDGRRLLLMVCAATGFPESFFGDVSVGTLATARSLDRPTELLMRDRQTLWGDVFRNITEYQLRAKGKDPKVAKVSVTFPALLEHDVEKTIQAIVDAATLGGNPLAGTLDVELVARLLLTALGEDNVDEIISGMDFDAMAPEQPDQPDPGPEAVPPEPTPQDPERPVTVAGHARRRPVRAPTASEAMMLEAVRELRRAISVSQAAAK